MIKFLSLIGLASSPATKPTAAQSIVSSAASISEKADEFSRLLHGQRGDRELKRKARKGTKCKIQSRQR